MIEVVQNLKSDERERIVEKCGIDDEIRNKITSNLTAIQNIPQISENEYYARAMFDLYNWEQLKINFTKAQKEKLIKKMQERQVDRIYKNLIENGISEENIPTIILNLITTNREDIEEILNQIEQGNLTNNILKQLNNENSQFTEPLRAEQLEDYLEFYKVEGTDIRLRDYQQSAINKVDKIFEEHKFASVILPTGAGKSFVAIAELMKMQAQIEQGSDEQILYLAPSNEILEQIMKYTEKYVHGEKLGKTREQIFKERFPNVKLATYQSLLKKDEIELQNEKYKFMVFDELHRTGAKEWGEKLKTVLEAQAEDVRVLGITATPERDMDGRNMADEIALKLGFSEEQVNNRRHIAKKMNLIDAIRLGIVVNPKIVECDYNLKNDTERWESLLEKINEMEDGPEKDEYIQKYNSLRRKIDEAQEIPELLRDSIVKKDGKYIFYMPIGANEYNEDDEGNSITKKSGADKVKQAQKQLQEWLKYVDAEPEFYSMLGEYGDKRNLDELNAFENSDSEHIKIMIVMNKLNEGVHVEGINGIIWQRALDENSKILLLQQLGRAIYSINEGEKINDEDRTLVIDLPNNLTRVDLEKEINTYTEIDDIEMLQNVLDWIEEHEGFLPDINSTFKEETRMATTLKRIQSKYIKYMDDEEFEKLDKDKIGKIETILEMGNQIDLWDIELPDKEKKTGVSRTGNDLMEGVEFSLSGILRDYIDLEREIDDATDINMRNYLEYSAWCVENGRIPRQGIKGVFASQNREQETPEQTEMRLGRAKNSFFKKLNQKTEQDITDYEKRIRELYEELDEKYAIDINMYNYIEYREWCEKNGRKPKTKKGMVLPKEKEYETPEQTECRLGRARIYFFNRLKRKEKDEITQNEEYIRRLYQELDDRYVSAVMQKYNEYKQWCDENGRLPELKSDVKPAKDIKNETPEQKEYRLAQKKIAFNSRISKKTEQDMSEEERIIKNGYEELSIKYSIDRRNYKEYEQWCKDNGRLPRGQIQVDGILIKSARKGEKESKEQAEQRIGRAKAHFFERVRKKKEKDITTDEQELIKLYEELERQYLEMSADMKNYTEYREWCEKNGRKPRTSITGIKAAKKGEEETPEQIEQRLGSAKTFFLIKLKNKKPNEITNEELEIKELYEKIRVLSFHEIMNTQNFEEYSKWCKENGRKPRSSIAGIKAAKKGEEETPEQLELRLGRMRESFFKKKNMTLEEENIKKQYVELDKLYKKRITTTEIGQVSYSSTIEQCDEAQRIIKELILEKEQQQLKNT